MEQVLLIKWTFDQARALRAMTWRNSEQGIGFNFTGKGKHEGTGENIAHFIAAFAYGNGKIAAEQYHGRINAEKFSPFA